MTSQEFFSCARSRLYTTRNPELVAQQMGYNSYRQFANFYKQQFGITPKEDLLMAQQKNSRGNKSVPRISEIASHEKGKARMSSKPVFSWDP